ncbi:MAG: LytTR family DNA-binding domain-containing protein [Bacteroidota bacterium]
MKYKVLIVDDEEPARDLLVNYAHKIEELEVVQAVSNVLDAKRVLNNQSIDILLTDIQMDDLTGIDLVKMLKNPPVTIFTTAYSEYALEGYELDVIDYLVKPISFQRFCKAIDKAMELIRYKAQEEKTPTTTSQQVTSTLLTNQYFFVKTNRKIVKVAYEDLLFVQSFGEYVKLYTKEDVLLALQTTAFMEKMLPATDFIRIHRSNIININHIKEIDANQVIIEQHRLTISKRMKESFNRLIQQRGMI